MFKFKPKIWNKLYFFHIGGGGVLGGGALRRTQVSENFRILGYSGGPGWPIDNRSWPILLPSYPLTYINLHIKLCYRENYEVSADAAADAA